MKQFITRIIRGLCISLLAVNLTAFAYPNSNSDIYINRPPVTPPVSSPAHYTYTQHPTYFAMVGDALIARPLLLGLTILGTGLFFITLPLTVISSSVDQAGTTLVANPARETFQRCLGCITPGTNPYRS